jgi:pimeloyl-ACP methyl ester carboxylesterase
MLGDLSGQRLAELCAGDSEFMMLSRHWNGSLRLLVADDELILTLVDGVPTTGPSGGGPGHFSLSGPEDVWSKLLSPVPPRGYNDIFTAVLVGLRPAGHLLTYWQYYPAIQRVIDLIRAELHGDRIAPNDTAAVPAPRRRQFDSPTGRYVHIEIDGLDYRIYFEEAGAGIPLLLQHTAGSHGSQWRHLFELPEITDHFRLIAYDLPYHGKSLPPDGVRWWASEYRLTRDFAMSVPLKLSEALGLDRPVFMGCSVGGLLALDLGRYHPEAFRAVISLEPSLKIEGSREALAGFWHPQVSNEFKARLMLGLMSPTSPEARRMETVFAYSSGWPPAFLGDLFYYIDDHDLRDEAARIDTARLPVFLLTGEYDNSATIEHGRAAHEKIPGSSFAVMDGIGHFPMSENPGAFVAYLLPILKSIRSHGGGE